MKKLLILLLTVACLLSAAACGKEGSPADTSDGKRLETESGSESGNTGVSSEQENNADNNITVNLDIMETVENCLRMNVVEGYMGYIDSENRGYFYEEFVGERLINLKNNYDLDLNEIKQMVFDDYQHDAYYLLEDRVISEDGDKFFYNSSEPYNVEYICVEFSAGGGSSSKWIFGVTQDGSVLYQNVYQVSDEIYELEGLKNVKYVSCFDGDVGAYVLAVHTDGTASLYGVYGRDTWVVSPEDSGITLTEWKDIVWAEIGETNEGLFAVGLKSDGSLALSGAYPKEAEGWNDLVFAGAGRDNIIYGLKKDGTVVIAGDYLKDNPEAVAEIESWKNIIAVRLRGLRYDNRYAAIDANGNMYGALAYVHKRLLPSGEWEELK